MLAVAKSQPLWLNIDLGEWPNEADALYAAAHVANIACGGHAGDDASVEHAVACCVRYGTAISAHPGYPDREGFGRTVQNLPAADLYAALRKQMEMLHFACQKRALPIEFLKPHGALYHQANVQPAIAEILLDAATPFLADNARVIGPGHGALREAAQKRGWGFAVEGFADRGRRRDSSGAWQLIPRSEPGAVLHDAQEVRHMLDLLMAEGEIHTVCLHGDNPAALELAPRIREVLNRNALAL